MKSFSNFEIVSKLSQQNFSARSKSEIYLPENLLEDNYRLSHRSDRQPKTYVKPKPAVTVFEPLMMGGVSPETC